MAESARARVAILGAGTMGAGLVRLFADSGYTVRVFDVCTDAARCAARTAGASAAPSVAEAVEASEACIEAVAEDLEVKQALFAELAACTPHSCVLATNTSSLSVEAIGARLDAADRERLVGTHFFNPPELIPVVEVVRAPQTSEATVQGTLRILARAGKEAAVVADMPGFVANRIQHAMIVEAWRCLEEGVATPEAIDSIVSGSFGFRLFAYGPFAVGDFNGLDVYQAVMGQLQAAYGQRFAPPRSLTARVERGELGLKTGKGVYAYSEDARETLPSTRDGLLRQLSEFRAALRSPPGPSATTSSTDTDEGLHHD